jgi:hypothetical protein
MAEMDKSQNSQNSDSVEQQKQALQNVLMQRNASDAGDAFDIEAASDGACASGSAPLNDKIMEGFVDKRLDGPNRPST